MISSKPVGKSSKIWCLFLFLFFLNDLTKVVCIFANDPSRGTEILEAIFFFNPFPLLYTKCPVISLLFFIAREHVLHVLLSIT